MSENKIVIIGAGHVGSHCASALARERVAGQIVLLDTLPEKAAAQAADVADSVSFMPAPVTVRDGDYGDCDKADLVVVSVGQPRLPGQTRLDMLADSVVRVRDVAAHLKKTPFDGIVITITNPADIIADCMRKELGAERWRCFGTGTLLDTARLLRTLSELTGVDRRSIQAFSMGEHGDSSMIPFSHVAVGGVPFEQLAGISKQAVLARTRVIGTEIIENKGSTEFGIGLALATMARAVLNDEKRVLPASVLLDGEYNQRGVHCGVPCLLGRGGIEKILELDLTPAEQSQLDASCEVIRRHIALADAQERV
jgi:L-lactate dehydrogenase